MELQTERKYIVNRWIINARWFYVLGILCIGMITKQGGRTNADFSYLSMFLIALFVLALNSFFYAYLRRSLKENSITRLNILGFMQITVELAAFTLVMHQAGGVESIALVFYFLPIVSAATLFGFRGGLISALISGLLVNLLVIFEYYGVIPHIYRYGVLSIEYQYLSISLIKTFTISIFYGIVGIFTGYGAKLLLARENALQNKTLSLTKEKNIVSSMIASFEDPIIFLDDGNNIEIFNPAAEQILGMKIADKELKIEGNLNMDNFRKATKTDYKVIQPKYESYELPFEEVSLFYRGKEMNYRVITAEVKGKDGRRYGNMKIFNNITREKIIDKLKSEFISIAAHQLRTPLTVIKWITKSLMDGESGKINDEQKELLNKGYISNERMIELIDNLLKVSRMEDGKFDLKLTRVNLKKIIDEVMEDMSRIAKNKDVVLVLDEPEAWPDIVIDPSKITLVMENLLDNAVKYTPPGRKVEISVGRESEYLKITVRDEGIGIPEKDRDRLFSKFYRSPNAIRVETEGNGLGLYIAKKIIDGHKGKIDVDSSEGKGSVFTVYLPLTTQVLHI
ncbi:MAG: ATP-binding protein [Candidatus Falkowbacteria bacterium]